MDTPNTNPHGWQRSKLLIKGLIIGGLVLLLLIPAYFVGSLINEREIRQKEAVLEVSSKWAGSQILTGPIVVLPYWVRSSDTARGNIAVKQYSYYLPANLSVQSAVTPIEKHRGIYRVMLYSSESSIAGDFKDLSPSSLKINEADIIWNETFVKMHISDSRGLNNEIILAWNDTSLVMAPLTVDDRESQHALGALLPVTSVNDLKHCRFSATVNLKGSEKLLFSPVGKVTNVSLKSTWTHPSFTGSTLPDSSTISRNGFTASWRSLSHTRSFPQQWKNYAHYVGNDIPAAADAAVTTSRASISSSCFGADLFIPVNGYQKTTRSIKYAILCILLTFTAFFLIETTNRRSIHPVQYALIGFALILFYTLLLSFSEYTGFNSAYGIASLATVGLIGWFVKGLLGSARLSLLLSFVLLLLYSYVFTILQLQDYALLLGSIGLFLTLAVVMRFSKKIQWS